MKNVQLRPHQRKAVDFIKTHPYCGLFLEMGLGKSLSTLAALYEIKPAGNILVIAPLKIARSTWVDEVEKWGFPLRTQSLIVNEKDKKLTRAKRHAEYDRVLHEPPKMYFMSQDLIHDLVDFYQDRKLPWPFPTVIIDESQGFKNFTSRRTKALKKVRPQISRLILLTGTPMPNGLMDIFSQMYLLDQGAALGKTLTSFRNRYFHSTLIVNGYPARFEPNPGADKVIHEKIAPLTMSMRNVKGILPKVVHDQISVYLPPSVQEEYSQFKQEMVTDAVVDGELTTVIAENAAVLSSKLIQFSTGHLYVDDQHNYVTTHTEKLDALVHVVSNIDSPILVAYRFKSERDEIHKRLTDEGYDVQIFDGTREMTARWNKREIPIMLIHPASAGHGLNLQHGGHHLVWYTLPWSPGEYAQTNARLARPGQEETVVIHEMITKNTFEERLPDILLKKKRGQDALLDYVAVDLPGHNRGGA